ncbi:MAG: ATP-binding protein [Parvularculaceae bacterium]
MADGTFQQDANNQDATDKALAALYAGAPDSVSFRKLRKRILRQTLEAIRAYSMIDANAPRPRWLVCLSGGKDSYSLLAALVDLKWRGALDAEILATAIVDQGQPGFPKHVLPDFLAAARRRLPHRKQETPIRSSRKKFRRAKPIARALLAAAPRITPHRAREGCAGVVLGHHQDDALETFLLNLFHGGALSAIAPKLLNDEGDLLVLSPAYPLRRRHLQSSPPI